MDKKRVQTLIDQQQTNLADVAYLDLNSVAKIVEEFENPTLPEKINIELVKPLEESIKEAVTEQAKSLGEAVEFVTAEQMKSFLTLPRFKSWLQKLSLQPWIKQAQK